MDANFPPLDDTTLQALIDQPENDNLEFKSKLLPNSLIAEYLVGIGNAGGGLLIMGVTDKKPRTIVGIPRLNVEQLQQLRRSLYDSTTVRVELETVSTATAFVLAVRIPARPRGSAFHTTDGKYLIRVGDALVALTSAQLSTIFAESHQGNAADEALPISLRFTAMQHAGHFSALLRNDSDIEIRPKEIWLEKDGLKLGDPVRKDWPAVKAHSAADISWQPNRNPVDMLILKQQERMAGREVFPRQTFMVDIDICLRFACRGNQRQPHREKVMVQVDPTNRSLMQWS